MIYIQSGKRNEKYYYTANHNLHLIYEFTSILAYCIVIRYLIPSFHACNDPFFQTNNWQCKLLTSLWQYFTTANYAWILMEGLYLYNLIFRALFADSSGSIIGYVVMGWGKHITIYYLKS